MTGITIMLVSFLITTATIFAVDLIFSIPLDDRVIECVVTDKDLDNKTHYVTVRGIKESFAKTIEVDVIRYAACRVDDECVVLVKGKHRLIGGNKLTYTIE